MRSFLGLGAVGALLLAVYWAGNHVLADDPVAAAGPSAATLGTTESHEGGTSTSQGSEPTASKRRSHPPRIHHVQADMALARAAILHAADMEPGWQPAPPPKGAPICRRNNPDLSRFTITGEASSSFKTPVGVTGTSSRVRIFANGGQAASYFETVNTRVELLCIRDSVKRWLASNGWRPHLLYARLQTEPPIGAKTAIFLVGFRITLSTGQTVAYPVEILKFQMNRGVGTLSYDFIRPGDPNRPCQCELNEARLVAGRLMRAYG
jgi:hypothetical protein